MNHLTDLHQIIEFLPKKLKHAQKSMVGANITYNQENLTKENNTLIPRTGHYTTEYDKWTNLLMLQHTYHNLNTQFSNR